MRSHCSHILLITDRTCVMLTRHYFMSDLQINQSVLSPEQCHKNTDPAFRVCFILSVIHPKSDTAAPSQWALQIWGSPVPIQAGRCQSQERWHSSADTSDTSCTSEDSWALVELNAAPPHPSQPSRALGAGVGPMARPCRAAAEPCIPQQIPTGSKWLRRNRPRTRPSPEPQQTTARGSRLIQPASQVSNTPHWQTQSAQAAVSVLPQCFH